MGVDHDAHFGIGFIVDPSDVKHLMIEQSEDCDIDEMEGTEIMECLDLPDGIGYTYWGNSYSGNHTYAIVASKDATSKDQMIKQWDQLEAFIKEHNIEGVSVALVGGPLLW
jgi:hypothetical protein